jgi:hypothetical protein
MACIMYCNHKPFRACHSALVFAVAFLFYSLLIFGARADLKVVERMADNRLTLFISGTITQSDAAALQALSEELDRASFTVQLDSRGGDVSAATKIGRLIRKYEGVTFITSPDLNAKCYSSCALIFIGGVLRLMDPTSELGLHRPYLAASPQRRQEVEKEVPLMFSEVRQFIVEMDITDNSTS